MSEVRKRGAPYGNLYAVKFGFYVNYPYRFGLQQFLMNYGHNDLTKDHLKRVANILQNKTYKGGT